MSKEITRDAAIGTLINKAGKAAGTMLALTREAAEKAAGQLDGAKPLKARIDEVVALYSADFKAAGHNVRALFVDALTLHACKNDEVMITAIGKDGKKVDQVVTAQQAATMSKHAMKDAVKQVRDSHGIGRKAGAGRKAAPKAAPAPDMVTASEVDAFSAWLDNLEPYFLDAVYHTKIQARLIEMGFTVSKAAKGRKIKGSASE
jgi:hypothetical protein